MRKEVEEMISKQRVIRQANGLIYDDIKFLRNYYKISYNTLQVKLDVISWNNTDIHVEAEDINAGPFTLRFNKDLPNLEEHTADIAEYDESSEELNINDQIYRLIDTDLVYFISDLNGDEAKTIANLLNNFCEYLRK